MTLIPEYTIDMIRERVNIREVISQYVELKKKGKDHYGLCPFCGGKAFSVSPKGFFKCFVCGEAGDAIKFLTLSGMPFRDAVVHLGQRCGIDVEAESAKGSQPPPDYDPERRKRERKRHEAEQLEKQEADWALAATKLGERFRKAEPAREDHPYLVSKGITSAPGLKQEGNTLLVPMRAVETEKSLLMSIQAITTSGEKRFAEGGRTGGTRTVIGAKGFKEKLEAAAEAGKSPKLYICEGWATGWTIWHLTGDAVVVAFSTGNLKAVAVETARRYPNAKLIIAADNDRWKKCHLGPNPGVLFARAAAEASGAKVVIPDFEGLLPKERPTDFNDLWQREGKEMALHWLKIKNAKDAVIEASPDLAEEEPEPESSRSHEKKEEEEESAPELPAPSVNGADPGSALPEKPPRLTWLDTADFRPIGYDTDRYYYMPKQKGTIAAFTIAGHSKQAYLSMAPLSWWQHEFGGETGVSWNTATDALFRACEQAGFYRPERLRGRGCWLDDEGVVLHLGNRLLPPGGDAYVKPETFSGAGDHIYERRMRLAGPSADRALGAKQARKVLSMFQDLMWLEDASGDLLAGWTVLAPLSGALSWRPHVWLVGSPGSGKSIVLKDLVVPLLGGEKSKGGMGAFYEAGTTEAGIRQELRADALPIVYDEAEKDLVGSKSDNTMQAVLALARSASSASGSSVVKGSSGGSAVSFQVWSMFCLASVSPGLRQEQDKTRVSVLQLHGSSSMPSHTRRTHWANYQPRLAGIDTDVGRELIARTLGWLRDGRLTETIKIFKAAAAQVLGDSRSGDQYGTLYAGAWTLMSEVPPDMIEAKEMIEMAGVQSRLMDQLPEGQKVLETLLQAGARLEFGSGPARTLNVGELVDIVRAGSGGVSDTTQVAREWLNRHGMKVEIVGGDEVLIIANRSKWVERILRETPYGDAWREALRSIKGVEVGGPQMQFHAGLSSRVVIVPLYLLHQDDEEEGENE